MKKNLFFIAAAAIAFAACSNEEILVDNEIQGGTEQAIGFGTYAGKATRAENSTASYNDDLSAHHTNFAVWGYKNTEKAKVFNNQTVEYKVWSGSDKTWNYTPLRYWDKAATTYYYYAAAPQTDENGATVGWSFQGTENDAKDDQNGHSFKLENATLYGSNLSANADATTGKSYTTTYVESFINAPKIAIDATNKKQDIDYMIAEPKSVGTANFTSSPVELKFIHILSRLNVTIKKGTTLDAAAVVTLKSLEVVNLNSVGTFTESSNGATSARPGANDRWSAQGTQYTLSSIQNYEVTSDAAYVLQSLVIPQTVACETEAVKLDGSNLNATESSRKPYLKIVYTIDPDGASTAVGEETYTAYYNLAAVFGAGTATSYASTVLATGTSLAGYYTKNEYTKCAENTTAVAGTKYYELSGTTYTEKTGLNEGDDVSSYYTKTVSYTACDAGATADGATTYYQLVGTTLAFNEGWQNTLNLTIEPTVISFSTKVAEWADYVINDYTVE